MNDLLEARFGVPSKEAYAAAVANERAADGSVDRFVHTGLVLPAKVNGKIIDVIVVRRQPRCG